MSIKLATVTIQFVISLITMQCYFSFSSCYAVEAPYLLLVTAANKDSTKPDNCRQLICISQNQQLDLVDLPSAIWVGKDSSTFAVLGVSSPNNGCPLWVVNRKDATIEYSNILNGVSTLSRIERVGDLIAVRSEGSDLYFPASVKGGAESGYGFAVVNWKTGKLEQYPFSYKGLSVHEFKGTPSGFAITFKDVTTYPRVQPSVAFYDVTNHNISIIPLPNAAYDMGDTYYQTVFLPKVGLMEYYQLELICLTDSDLSTNHLTVLKAPVEHVHSKIFARIINGDPCLIWGESKDDQSRFGQVSELVVFDWKSQRYILCESLDTTASTFQPDEDGKRIYFLDSEDGLVKFMDIKSKEIVTFSDRPVKNPKGALIVDVY
jgi:hypothetical protein